MNERLLQYIWRLQYFNKQELQTSCRQPLSILFPGLLNTDQGPDFSQARIRIGTTTWVGAIELHIKTSDWLKHGHEKDTHYNQVVLHVVWQDDGHTITAHNQVAGIPVLELCGVVPKLLLKRYEQLLQQQGFIACENSIKLVKDIVWQNWKERLLIERLTRKAERILKHLSDTQQFWEAVFWWQLAAGFGLKVNAEAFEAVAKSLPVPILARHRNQIHQLEALLLGQAGLLNGSGADTYELLLQQEYRFLKKKYRLQPIHAPVYFMRMRPANFPTIRLAQLAMLIHQSVHLFATIKETESLQQVADLFSVTPNDYWLYHYRFNDKGVYKQKQLGKTMFHSIVINTICPLLFAYGVYYQDDALKTRAVNWLVQTKAENNHVITGYRQKGIRASQAADSQALLELYSQYCVPKKCLDCAVGSSILKSSG